MEYSNLRMSPTGEEKPRTKSGPSPPPMRKLSRSQSITSSSLPPTIALPPELENVWRRRRQSLEKLQLDKVAPWMHLHDFSEGETATAIEERLKRRRQSIEKLQLDKVAPWIHVHLDSHGDFTEPGADSANQQSH